MLRNFLFLASLIGVTCFLEASKNVVFILADDMNRDSWGTYGNKDCKTPHIDRLANEGVKFERAYCSVAMCPLSARSFTVGDLHGVRVHCRIIPSRLQEQKALLIISSPQGMRLPCWVSPTSGRKNVIHLKRWGMSARKWMRIRNFCKGRKNSSMTARKRSNRSVSSSLPTIPMLRSPLETRLHTMLRKYPFLHIGQTHPNYGKNWSSTTPRLLILTGLQG